LKDLVRKAIDDVDALPGARLQTVNITKQVICSGEFSSLFTHERWHLAQILPHTKGNGCSCRGDDATRPGFHPEREAVMERQYAEEGDCAPPQCICALVQCRAKEAALGCAPFS
jgi:hypothetical protein